MTEEHEAQPRWFDLLTLPILVGVILGGILWWRDVPVWRVVVIALTAAGAGYFIVRSSTVPPVRWPTTQAASHRYSRRNLDWLLSGIESDVREPEGFPHVLRPRLVTLATGVLARSSVPLGSERAQQLLGVRFHQLLTDPECRPPQRRELLALMARITALAQQDPDRPLIVEPESPAA